VFPVDDGFAYAVPEGMDVPVGSIVRIPLGGRRVRGFVISSGPGAHEGLKEILAVSGDFPVFDTDLLGVLRWAAVHYVAPAATVLSKAAPPNLPRRGSTPDLDPVPDLTSPLPEVTAAAAAGKHTQAHFWLGPGPWGSPIAELAAPVLAAGRSVVVAAPSFVEATDLAEELGVVFGNRVVVGASGLGNAALTKAWARAAAQGGLVVVGTRDVAYWPISDLALAVVVDEGRRGMVGGTALPPGDVRGSSHR
jgi:primosomal protein N' (replication factor Y)